MKAKFPRRKKLMKGIAGLRDAIQSRASEIEALLEFSSRIGKDPSLVQASSGNTSVKIDETLWIKASGKWLADANRQQILVPVQLAKARERFREGAPLTQHDASSKRAHLRPSVETFMHAVLPQRVVVHVHSVNTIAWAVRSDAPLQLAERLCGLPWEWIPYATSGLSLAREIQSARERSPGADVFVLGNHGLVVCGEDCDSVEDLLFEVEWRLTVTPRFAPPPRRDLRQNLQALSGWRLAQSESLQALGTDVTSRRIMQRGVLYPCQGLFLGRTLPHIRCSRCGSEMRDQIRKMGESHPFVIVEGGGVLISDRITAAEWATLDGFARVLRRIDESASLRYLTDEEVDSMLAADGHHYRTLAETRASLGRKDTVRRGDGANAVVRI